MVGSQVILSLNPFHLEVFPKVPGVGDEKSMAYTLNNYGINIYLVFRVLEMQ